MSGSVGGGDDHAGVLQELFGAQWWTGRQFVLLVAAVFVLLPLVLRRRVGEFAPQLRRTPVGFLISEVTNNSLVEVSCQKKKQFGCCNRVTACINR